MKSFFTLPSSFPFYISSSKGKSTQKAIDSLSYFIELLKSPMGNTFVYFSKFLIALDTSILAPLLPLLMLKMQLSLTLSGSLISIFSLFNSLLQPLFGWMEDRIGYRLFLVFAPLWVGIFIGAIGISPSYGWLVLSLILVGIGICSFHPASFAYAGRTNSNQRAIVISFLIMADALGFIIGPIAVTSFVSVFGIKKLYLWVVPSIIITIASWKMISLKGSSKTIEPLHDFRQFREIIIPLIPLFIFTLSIAIVSMNLFSLTPFLLKGTGIPITVVGFFLSAFAFGSALGPIIGSLLAKKMGKLRVIRLSMTLSICFLPIFLLSQRLVIQVCFFFLSGLGLMGPFSIMIDMAQEMFPKYLSMTSTFLSGFTWGVGGLLVVLTAKIAETLGVKNALIGMTVFPVINLFLAYFVLTTGWFQRLTLSKGGDLAGKLYSEACNGVKVRNRV